MKTHHYNLLLPPQVHWGAYWSIITTVRLFQLIEQHQLLPWDSTTDTYNQHVIHTMMDNSNPGSRDLVVLPTGLAHTVMYAYKYTVAVVAARAYNGGWVVPVTFSLLPA